MNDITLLKDLFVYFAKFPDKKAVQALFNRKNNLTAYSQLRNEIDALPEVSLLPDIKDYVFASSDFAVRKFIEDVKSTYLLVDFGNITISKTQPVYNEFYEFQLAIVVATPGINNNMDHIEHILQGDHTLWYINYIREVLKVEAKTCKPLQGITFPISIEPWFSRDLKDSNGWRMSFYKKGVELL